MILSPNLSSNGTVSEIEFKFNNTIQRSILGSVYIVVIICGLSGNLLVILSVMLSRKLHTVSNVFVVNLSIADSVTCVNLHTVMHMFSSFGVQVGPDWLCFLTAGMNLLCIIVSIMTLASISVTRVLVVTRPFAARFSRYVYCVTVKMNLIFSQTICINTLGYQRQRGILWLT